MSRKRETRTHTIDGEIVEDIDHLWQPVFRDYMRRWSHLNAHIAPPSLQDLCRALYMQGVIDGTQVGCGHPELAELFDG